MPFCSFCGRHHSSKRGEHVIPKWLTREFPDVNWNLRDTLTNYVRKNQKYIHITTPVPCSQCNNQWMSDLEKLSKPVLLPLIHGIPSTLTLRDQVIIATWFFKTAVMYDLYSEKQAPRPRYFEDDEHRLLRSSLSHNPAYIVFIGKFVGAEFFTIQETHSGPKSAIDSLKPAWVAEN